jgi:hypothetical protein
MIQLNLTDRKQINGHLDMEVGVCISRKGYKETFQHDFACDGGSMNVYICQN